MEKKHKKRSKLQRYQQIVGILLKYGFGEIVSRLKVRLTLRLRKSLQEAERSSINRKPFAERLRLAFEELGPAFIKFGQMLSMRADLLPEYIIQELQHLQDRVPPFGFDRVKAIIRKEFGKPVEELFTTIDPEPIAAASIAQCHRAVTLAGQEVAVKVQRPDIKDVIETDINILFDIARLMERHFPDLRNYRPVAVVNEFAITIRNEMDFVKEGRNMTLFRDFFRGDKTVYIPAVVKELNTKNVLCMEYIDGIKAYEVERFKAAGLDKKTIAINGARAVLKQIFEFGVFHADPHPGNFFILKGNVIAAVDFGIVGYVDDQMKRELINAATAFIRRDAARLIRVFRDLNIIEDSVDTIRLQHDLNKLINYYYHIPLAELDLGKLFFELTEIIRKYDIYIPSDFVLMVKTLATMESFGRTIYPEFDIISLIKPYVSKLLVKRLDPSANIKDFTDTAEEVNYFLRNLPTELRFILKKLRTGNLKIKLDAERLDYIVSEMDRANNRLSASVIIAAIVIGSSFIINIDKGPQIMGLPLFGIGGFVIAGFLGIWLVIGILRSGRL
jgi:ubiquinone biosynthesis protein